MANLATEIAANSSSYVGNQNLGGAGELAIQIDTRPIQQLAAYTLMYNKSQYDQRQRDADEKIKELAKLTTYDATRGYGKDNEKAMAALSKIRKIGSDFAATTWSNPDEKDKAWFKFQIDKADVINELNAINARKIKLDKYTEVTQLDSKLSADQKELKIKQAEKLFSDTDIYTLPNIPETDITVQKIGEPVYDKAVFLRETPNGMIKEQKDQWSFSANDKASYLEANNLMLPILPPNATQQQKDEYEQKKLAFEKSDIGVWKMAEDAYANALTDPNYKKTETTSEINVMGASPVTQLTGVVDIDKVKRANPIIGGILGIGERYNNYAQERIKQIQDGYYIDKVTGEKMLLQGGDTVEDITLLDLSKPLSAKDLINLQKFAKAAPDKIDKVYSQTDNAIQTAQIAETIRNNKADQYLKGKQIKLEEDKWKTTQKGGQTQINGAMERAKRIYADMIKLADENGVISPDKLRQLNVEQLKYLGIEAPQQRDADGKITDNGGFKPLSFSSENKTAIQLVNGEIKVLENAEKLSNGSYKGQFNNTKSTNLYNIGTNILNEELKIAGGKEINAYMGVDVTGGITSNTDGGSVSQSGSTKTQVDQSGYSRDELKAANWTDAQIDKAVKAGKIKLK